MLLLVSLLIVLSFLGIILCTSPFTPTLSHRYSGEDRDVLVQRVVLEHALGNENVLDLPQHVLPQIAAQDLAYKLGVWR
jgi:hypothetical protein